MAQDILPYMCIYEQCPLPDEMYLTSEELIKHIREHHGTTMWSCPYCLQKTSEDNSCIFKTSEQWQNHMQQAHGNLIPEEHLLSLAGVSERQVIQDVACPLCAYSPEGIQTTVDQHILQHLHEFSLRSLPPVAGDDTQDSISNGSVGASNSDWEDMDEDESPTPQLVSFDVEMDILRTLGAEIGVDKTPIGDETVRQNWQSCMREASVLSSVEHELPHQYSEVLTRIRMMIRQARDTFLSDSPLRRPSEVDLDRNLFRPLQVEFETLSSLRTAGYSPSIETGMVELFHGTVYRYEKLINRIAIAPARFDLDLPPASYQRSLPENHDVLQSLEDFVLGKQNGFVALAHGDDSSGPLQVLDFARTAREKYSHDVFWVDCKAIFGHKGSLKTIGEMDQVLGQIATELLGMSDLLDVLAQGDIGTSFVEAIIKRLNNKAKAKWVVVISNLAITAEDIHHDYIRWPKISIQGSVIITALQSPLPPSDWHRISLGLTPIQSYTLDTSRLFPQFSTFVAERKLQGRNCEGEDAKYVPFSALLEFWTRGNIDRIFNMCDVFPIAQDVRRNYIRVLSTLVYISVVENRNSLHYFRNIENQQRDDSSLPWLSIPQRVFEGPHATQIFDLFFEHQWMFCPAVLDQEKRMSDRELHPRHVLPFTTNVGIHISHKGRDATLSVVNINKEAHSHLEHNVSIS